MNCASILLPGAIAMWFCACSGLERRQFVILDTLDRPVAGASISPQPSSFGKKESAEDGRLWVYGLPASRFSVIAKGYQPRWFWFDQISKYCVLLRNGEREAKDELTQRGLDEFYDLYWHEMHRKSPKLEALSARVLETQLKGRFIYLGKNGSRTSEGSILFRYPNWDWPDDQSKGRAKQFGDKVMLVRKDNDLRAFVVRSEGRWLLIWGPDGVYPLEKADNR